MTKAIIPVLRAAGEAIITIYNDEDSFHTKYKADRSPLTAADMRSNQIICDSLRELYPDIPIISEENQPAEYGTRATYKKFFLLDPLDGTKEFIKRNGEFTINLAYLEEGVLKAGYVHVPVSKKTYFGEKFEGAWRLSPDDILSPLLSQSFSLNDPGIKVVASRSHRDPRTDKIISLLHHPEIVSIGSALKFIKLAEGEAHFYPRLAPTMEWDTAAAQCIVEESGGSVIRFDNRQPVNYNKPDLLSPYFLAYSRLLDPESLYELLDRIAR
jgi:3'(2'), 5'-bisphosphate nucleotidase